MSSDQNPYPSGSTIPEEPEVVIRRLLFEGIDPEWIGVQFDLDAHLSTGRSEGPEEPGTITVAPGDEGVVNGGTSGQTSLLGGGQGVHQHRSGLVYVDCWGGTANDWSRADPQDVRADLKNAVYAALASAYRGTYTDAGTPEFALVAPVDHAPIPDPANSPSQRYGYRVFVRYAWDRTSARP